MVNLHKVSPQTTSRAFCFEYRIGVEGEAAATAAKYRCQTDLCSLHAAMKQQEALHGASQISIEADFEFHLLVARASKNAYFVSSLKSLHETISRNMLLAIAPTAQDLQTKNRAIRTQHEAVFDAIANRDEARARQAMRDHLSRCHHSTRHWDYAESICEPI